MGSILKASYHLKLSILRTWFKGVKIEEDRAEYKLQLRDRLAQTRCPALTETATVSLPSFNFV